MTDLLHEYIHIITDPAHIGAEVTFIAVEAAIIAPIVRFLVKRHDRKAHGK